MPSELLLSRLAGRTWAALREEGTTVELLHERDQEPGAVGDVFQGRVTRIVPGIQSAFVDVGLERGAFLHAADLILPGEEPDPAPLGAIQDRLKEGRTLLVQVTREANGSKGARVSSHVSLAGRYLVHVPLARASGVSGKIDGPEERARLEGIVSRLPRASGGFIVRTAGRDVEEDAFRADAAMLVETWSKIVESAARIQAPALLHGGADLLLRLLRDAPRGGLDAVVVDDPADRERAVDYLRGLDAVLAARVRLHTGPRPIFETWGVDAEIDRALRPRVWLKSGAFLVVQQTEALVAVDVNSGKYLGREHPEETALRTNLEAAKEIARQLRLRDLGGIVVVDFIDMEREENRLKVIEALETALRPDRARTKVFGFGALGVVQLARQKRRRGLAPSLTRECPACAGTGRIKSADVVAREVIEEVRRVGEALEGCTITVRAHPDVAQVVQLLLETHDPFGAAGAPTVKVAEDPVLRPDHFDVLAL